MKLLDLTEFYSPLGGGVRTYLERKIAWMERQPEFEHVVVVSSNRDQIETVGRSRVYRVRGAAVPGSPGYHLLNRRARVMEILRSEQPDLVEVGSPFLAPWWAHRALGAVPLVGLFHSDERLVWTRHVLGRAPGWIRHLADRSLGAYLARVHRLYHATVATSRAAQASLARLGVGRLHLVPLGVDQRQFGPERRDPGWRREVGAPQGARVALYVGRLSTEKNLELVVRALPELHRRAGVFVVLVGEGHQRGRLEALARRHPERLAVLPFEPDRQRLARAYASADCFLAPCPYETFGLAALEAMASGLPVVGAAAGGVGELLAEAPAGERFVPADPSDPAAAAALVRAVQTVLATSPAPQPALHAWVAARYSWDRTFERLAAIYRAVLASAAPA